MPTCRIKTNYAMDAQKKQEFLSEVTYEMSCILDKPIAAVMGMISEEFMYMNNSTETVVYAEFGYIKDFASSEEKAEFVKDFGERMLCIFRKYTSVDPYRVYMQITEMPRDGAWKY